MAKFPEPPPASVLTNIRAAHHVLSAGTPLWRLYSRRGAHPRAWNVFRSYGPLADMRFDHHEEPVREQARGILYAASLGPICVAEFFQADRTIDRFGGEPWLVGFSVRRAITLLDLTGTWPTQAGASMALSSGVRARARRWSRTIYEAYPRIDGLWYPSSMYGNKAAVALYERADDAPGPAPFFHMPLSAPALYVPLSHIARQIGYRLV